MRIWHKSRNQVLFCWGPIFIVTFILASNLSSFHIHNDNIQVIERVTNNIKGSNSPNAANSLPIFQLYQDAKYAWDKLQLRKDVFGPTKTGLYFGTEVVNNVNSSTSNSMGVLQLAYAMYKMSNDSSYLDLARNLFLTILEYCSGQVNVSNTIFNTFVRYDIEKDVILDSPFGPLYLFIPLAFEDPFFIPYFEDLIADDHELFCSPIDLIYKSIDENGAVLARDSHLTWSPSLTSRINMLLWMAELTGDTKYKNWADDTIEAIWAFRSSTGLLPRKVDSVSGAILDSGITHYDMAGWLCTLELAYFLNGWNNSAGTGDHTYFELINTTAQGIADYMWTSSQIWGYKTTYNLGSASTGIPEMNAIYVDYAMILAYEITKNEEFLTKAILDFENEFMGVDPVKPTGVLMSNSLVIHSPRTLNTQSQFAGSSNIMVARTASLIYKHTQDEVFLQKAKYHYNHLMSTHRFPKGYTNMLDSISLQPYGYYNGYPAKIFDKAVVQSILALPGAFIPSENVTIDWGYGITTTMPDSYGQSGAFTGISIDIKQRRVHLKSVTANIDGSLITNFGEGSIIESVLIDNYTPYYSFSSNILLCEEGTHAYTITFTEPDNASSTLITNTLPTSTLTTTSTSTTSTPTSESSSISIETNTTSSSSPLSTTTGTDQTTGFLTTILPINLIGLALILSIRRKLRNT